MNNCFSKIDLIIWYVPLELNHSSYIYSSVLAFCKREKCKFSISYDNLNIKGRISTKEVELNETNHVFEKVTYITVVFKNGEKRLIAFDLYDIPFYFSSYALENADIVYKRSYNQSYVDKLPDVFKNKVKKMGLPFMVRPDELIGVRQIFMLFMFFKWKQIIKFDRFLFKRISTYNKVGYQHWKRFVNTRKVSDFDVINNNNNNNIFYQKRLFESRRDKDNLCVEKERVNLVRLLMKSFPDHFKGGIKKDRLSNNLYPNIISNIPGDQKSFLRAMQESDICIYTRGLHHSTGWTLPEFLSQGKCVIAEQLYNEIPVPLTDDEDVVFFRNEKELLMLCERLIVDESKRILLRKNAREYYEKNISPKMFLERIINVCQ